MQVIIDTARPLLVHTNGSRGLRLCSRISNHVRHGRPLIAVCADGDSDKPQYGGLIYHHFLDEASSSRLARIKATRAANHDAKRRSILRRQAHQAKEDTTAGKSKKKASKKSSTAAKIEEIVHMIKFGRD